MKISKKAKVAALIGIPVLIGAYLIYKQLKKPSPITPITPAPPKPAPTPAPTPAECKNYLVVTNVSNLNIRKLPSTSSDIVDSLAKGSTVSAKASSASGWMQLCDGRGYVSATYLSIIP